MTPQFEWYRECCIYTRLKASVRFGMGFLFLCQVPLPRRRSSMRKENTAKLLMAAAMFVFGTLAPFVRKIGVSSGELALYRAVLAAALVGAFLLMTRQKLSLGSIRKELLLLLLSGVAMGIKLLR